MKFEDVAIFRSFMVNTRAGGAPADAEGITRAEDEEEGLNDADRSTLYNLFKEDLQFIKPTRPSRFWFYDTRR